MITWVLFLRMFWNFISSLPVKRGGLLSFLVGTMSNVLVMEIGWTDVGSGGYILVSSAHSNTSYVSPRETYCFSLIFFFSFFSAKLVRTITFLSFQIGQLYLVCGCMTKKRCVTYHNDLHGTLTFDLKVK